MWFNFFFLVGLGYSVNAQGRYFFIDLVDRTGSKNDLVLTRVEESTHYLVGIFDSFLINFGFVFDHNT